MATRVELDKTMTARALTMAIASTQRAANNKNLNPLLIEIHNKDLAAYQIALNTLTEVK